MVGAAGFELATPCTPCKCATRLRYAPKKKEYIKIKFNLSKASWVVAKRGKFAGLGGREGEGLGAAALNLL